MKDVQISLSDQQISEIEAQVASGSFGSASEVIQAALAEFLDPLPGPSLEQVEKDIAAFEADLAAGVEMFDADAARAHIRRALEA